MPTSIAASFDRDQLAAIQQALLSPPRKRHAIQIHIPIGMGKLRYYLVLLVGAEQRRSPRRRSQEIDQTQAWTWANTLVVLLATAVGMLALVGLLKITRLDLSDLRQVRGPAAIPFIADQQQCENSGRTWQDDHCLDYEHDPTF